MSEHATDSTNESSISSTTSIANSTHGSITTSSITSTTSITNTTTSTTTNNNTPGTINSTTTITSASITNLIKNLKVHSSNLTSNIKSEDSDKLNKTDSEVPDVERWLFAASSGNTEKLKLLIEHGVDKSHTDVFGRDALWFAVFSGNISTVRYLLELGLTTCAHTSEPYEGPYLVISETTYYDQVRKPCKRAIDMDHLPMVRLLEQYGCETVKSFTALRQAVLENSSKVVKYLLSNYEYPLNQEYMVHESDFTVRANNTYTILGESHGLSCDIVILKWLICHGANPERILIKDAIKEGRLELIAQFIRGGFDVDYMLHHPPITLRTLLFEYAIKRDRIRVAEILLHAGGSCGIFSLKSSLQVQVYHCNPWQQALMTKWRVQENIVKPLQQSCRKFIVHHLYPKADRKISELPLPTGIIKYLGYPELDAIIDESTQFQTSRS